MTPSRSKSESHRIIETQVRVPRTIINTLSTPNASTRNGITCGRQTGLGEKGVCVGVRAPVCVGMGGVHVVCAIGERGGSGTEG
jgi:hypothetical protein